MVPPAPVPDTGTTRSQGRWKRAGRLSLAALLLVAAGAHIGLSPGARFTVCGPDGAPLAGVYVAYLYQGYRFNFVDSISYSRRGAVVGTNSQGRAIVPMRLYLKGPLDTYASPSIALLYAPSLHFAQPIWRLSDRRGGDVTILDRGTRVVLGDLAGDPEGWQRTLDELARFLWSEVIAPAQNLRAADVVVTPSVGRDLADRLRHELEALLARHAMTRRQEQPLSPYLKNRPPEEQAAAVQRMLEDLAREPLWGPRIERTWRRRLEALERDLPVAYAVTPTRRPSPAASRP